ncbi:hypothetical protein BGZ97_008966 [Linnemannia gamsii]|uniref:Crinkler effector protein N-terminal domain-containing protein n=1 Tax=Linnemannia gamsii TaxID=64522 RepID=A0A9P6UEH4_9FUNG|nr:hypothetical protein BGZ97_008966 [Linnemannia gamsii]
MSNDITTLFAIIDNDSTPQVFPVDIESSKTVGHLKDTILAKNPHTFHGIDARRLKLWHISVAIPENEGYDHVVRACHCDNKKLLTPANKLNSVFGTNPDGSLIHVLVQRV